ncbi:hypothetical protein [Streptomyces sviceus]|uniref:hypothetical protein n=1 Tax=Streptomyces sviceus TaxID=285530 RepID=UPI00332E9F85
MTRRNDDELRPARPYAQVHLSDETRSSLDEVHTLYEKGELYVGETGELLHDPRENDVVRRSVRNLAGDLMRYLRVQSREAEIEAALPRVNMWMETVRVTIDGWTYWGVYDHLRDECRYLGRTRGKEVIFD